jgi:hypothetical protein
MYKLYTLTIPTTSIFLAGQAPDGIDLDQYVNDGIDIDYLEESIFIQNSLVEILNNEKQLTALDNLDISANFSSAEHQNGNLVLTVRSDQFRKSDGLEEGFCGPSEVDSQLDIFRKIGFEITEQEI